MENRYPYVAIEVAADEAEEAGALHLELADNYLHVVSRIGRTGFILVSVFKNQITGSTLWSQKWAVMPPGSER